MEIVWDFGDLRWTKMVSKRWYHYYLPPLPLNQLPKNTNGLRVRRHIKISVLVVNETDWRAGLRLSTRGSG